MQFFRESSVIWDGDWSLMSPPPVVVLVDVAIPVLFLGIFIIQGVKVVNFQDLPDVFFLQGCVLLGANDVICPVHEAPNHQPLVFLGVVGQPFEILICMGCLVVY